MKIDKNKTIQGIKIWDNCFTPVKELKPLCRKIAAEGSVLLKNDGVLPFIKGTKVALFGRNQEVYIKSGTGSGGLVNVEKEPCILESFLENDTFDIDKELMEIYKDWIKDNPFDNGHGWATEPWAQVEMPINQELAENMASKNDVAVIIIGRTAGEAHDNSNTKGSYLITDTENELIRNVSVAFKKTVIVLNVGNLIDLSFLDDNNISALLYCWQGGQEGAYALTDILEGKISPSGKLPDTLVYSVEDYPSLADFGNAKEQIYTEDIYVGYRYFETFAAERVRYPFGYGLTYTDFDIKYTASEKDGIINVTATVKNIGSFTAKQVVQVYFGAPCGKLGTPSRQLVAFKKTSDLKPNEAEQLELSFSVNDMAAYDDNGVTENKYCYVLEQGDYYIFAGTDIKSAETVYSYNVADTTVVEQLEQVLPAEVNFERIIAKEENGKRVISYGTVPTAEYDLDERIKERRVKEIPFTGDKGIKLIDVAEEKNTIEEFVAQLDDRDLSAIICGEGMDSPKVTPGTGAAFGGVSDKLLSYGIPVCCVTDGPSGLRIGNGYKATSLPNGYVFAASFDEKLTEQIFELEGVELFRYNIDALLGPGMNIHRHPLCGRNFEYFSEDPILSGRIAAAQSRGIAKTGCSTTIKHFCANNQEWGRNSSNSIVSERALREIYLKGFKIAVKEGGATAAMTTYNKLNGYHNASNYDLATTVLRKEWGFEGFVMTDWWARFSEVSGDSGTYNLKSLVRSQNDIYMVTMKADGEGKNIAEGLNEGYIVRSDLQRCAINLLKYIIKSPTFMKYVDNGCVFNTEFNVDENSYKEIFVIEKPQAESDVSFELEKDNKIMLVFEIDSKADVLAQNTVSVTIDNNTTVSFSVSGTDGKIVTVKHNLTLTSGKHSINLDFPSVIEIERIIIKENTK